MKYAIDKIENNIATLESLDGKTLIEVDTKLLPKKIKEGSIIRYENNNYYLDIAEEQKRRETIKNKFDMLRKK